MLQERHNRNRLHGILQVGDAILIKDDTLPRNRRSMGCISSIEPDGRGAVGGAIIKTSTSELRRQVGRLVLLLPVEEQQPCKFLKDLTTCPFIYVYYLYDK